MKQQIDWKNKKVLVTGSGGMIGKELVILLKELSAEVFEFDIKRTWTSDNYDHESINIIDKQLTEEIFNLFRPEITFSLFGIKGNPKMTKERPADFVIPMLQGDTNTIEACQKHGVERMLYTSSIAVENTETDKYPAWAKKTAETLIEAMRIQYPKGTKYCIVRPSNVYGRFDNFNNSNSMVVTSLISKALKNKKLILDKKGEEQIRDIINAKDVARGMIKCMEEMPENPVNLCSGKEIKIKDIAEEISKQLNIKIEYKNLNLILGPNKKIMKNPYIKSEISLSEGIEEVIEYVKDQKR